MEVTLRTIAGVAVPDSAVATAAEALTRAASPPWLFHHCVRTYVFGTLAARRVGVACDAELAWVASLLHDLGLTERFGDERRFEVTGADAARAFALEHGLSDAQADSVWDAIALHASGGIASAKGGVAALVNLGASVDVAGTGLDAFPTDVLDAILHEHPRLAFKREIHGALLAAVRRQPKSYASTWLADLAREELGVALPSVHARLAASAFPE